MTQEVTQTLGYSLPEDDEDPIWARLCPTSCCTDSHSMLNLDKEVVTFGRDFDRCDIDLPSPQVSGVHAKIKRNLKYYAGAHLGTLYDLSTNGTYVNSKKIGKRNNMVLYEGDVIMFQTSSGDKIDRQIKKKRKEISFILYRNRGLDDVSDDSIFAKYDLRDTLGTGSFATVKLGIDRETGQRMAVKVIDRKKFQLKNTKKKSTITQESDIMQEIEHENIIKIHDVFDEEDSLYIVLEMATGGELFDRIVKHKRLTEDIARKVMKQLLSAVMYLHGKKLAHRDLKPENILMKSNDPDDWTVKITDFGLSRYMSEAQRLTTMCGTPMFLAPEVLHSKRRGGYDLAVDYWSLGVILYLMLVGHPPYKQNKGNDGGKKLLEDVRKGRFSFPEQSWKTVSTAGKDLVQKLMCLDVAKRYDGPHVLAHRWMRRSDSSSESSSRLSHLSLSGKKRRHQFGADDDCKDTLNGHRNRIGHHQMEGVPPRKRYKTGNRRDDHMSMDSVGSENAVRVDSVCGYTPKGRGV